MSKRYPGALITKTPVVPTSLSAPGIWSLSDQAAAQATNTWPFRRDPQFNYVTMLLHGDGSAGPVAATGVGAGVSTTVTNFNADASTNNFNVTINGDAKSNNFTPYQTNGYWSVGFTGAQTSPSLTYPSISAYDLGATSQFTYECWVYFASVSGEQSIFERWSGTGGPGWLLTKLSSNAYRAHFGSSVSIDTGAIAVAGQWIHLAVSRNGSTGSIFVNGTRQATTGSVVNFSDGTDPLVFGERNSGSQTFPFNGYISNARIVKGAFVYDPSSTSITVPTSPLTAITNTVFLGLQSNRYVDNSSNNATATASTASSVQGFSPFTQSAASLNAVATYGSGYFDGTGDYLSLTPTSALNLSTNSWTLEMWVNLNTVSTTQVLINFGYEGSTQRSFVFYLTSANVLQFAYSTNGSNNTDTSLGASGITTGTWNHLAVVRNSTTITVYRNGVAYGTTITIGASAINYTPGAFRIGVDATNYTNGYITDCRLVNGTAVYTSAFTPPTSPLTAITNTSLLTTQYNGGGNNSGFKDSSQFNFPITRNGNTTQGTFTPYGSNWSNYITGGAYETVPQNTAFSFGTGDFTVEFWINLNSYRTTVGAYYDCFVALGNYTNSPYFRVTPTGKPDVGLVSVGMTGSTTLQLRTWYHFAAVRSGTSAKLYINGVLDASVTSSDSLGNSSAVYIGTSQWGVGNEYMDGYISNIRIIKGTALYTAAFTPSVVPLTVITGTSLLTCQANSFKDSSTNNFAITPSGSPSVQRFSPFAPLTVYNPTTYGGSGYFDGSGDYLVASSTSGQLGSGDFTIECWSYLISKVSLYPVIWGNYTSFGAGSLAIFAGHDAANTSKYNIAINGTFPAIQSTASIIYNQWTHIALVRSGSTITLYVNGVANGTATSSATLNGTSGTTYIGTAGDAISNGYLNGYLTDSRVLVGTALYTSAFTPPTAPLTAITNTKLLLNYTNAAILDNSMLNNLETVGNAAVSTSVKKYGAASMYFDGTDDRLNMPSSPNLAFGTGDFTLEMWAYFTSVASFPTLTDSRSSTGSTAGFNLGLSTAKVQIYTTSQVLIGSSTLSTNTWYHIAVTRASGTLKIWLNGVQDATVANSTNWSDTTFVVGATPNAVNFMTGYIDDLRITKGVARYTATFTVPEQAFPNG
jgi:hypothetical protein